MMVVVCEGCLFKGILYVGEAVFEEEGCVQERLCRRVTIRKAVCEGDCYEGRLLVKRPCLGRM